MASIMRGLEGEAYDRQYTDRQLIKRIFSYFATQKGRVMLVVVAIVALSAINAAPPLIIARGINVLAETDDQSLVPILVGAVLLVGVFNWLINWIRRLNSVKIIETIVLLMRQDAFHTAARQDMSFFDEYSSGRIVSRITSDTEEFGRIIILVIDLVQQITTAVILIVTLFTIEWRLAMILVAVSPVVVIVATSFRNLARRVTRQSSRVLAEVNRSFQEAVTGISVAKNFRQEHAIYDGFREVNQQSYEINLRRGVILAGIFPSLAIMLGFVTGALVLFGGRAALGGIILISSWYLFVATVDRFWFPLLNLSAFWSQFQQGLSAAERVFALADSESSVIQNNDTSLSNLKGKINFEHLTFGYNDTEIVLNNFSLNIAPGESIAFVGHTGAGKSSIIKLVARHYEYQKGRLTVDGADIRDLDLIDYRSQLGIVSQVPFLFNETVAENIRYGRPDASDAEILATAMRIGEGEWLETLPDGLKTQVGERGGRLSMGQRQLVALTRVLVANPSIFILDEATANIDPFTESQIQEALELIMRDRTSILIAHRLSTVRSADRIVVLDHGDIIEKGSHDQLIADGGHYAELYDTYFRHQSLDAIHAPSWKVN